jgi:hypothetical protein
MDGGEKVSGELIVSGGDPSEILEPAKASLDDVSAFVGAFVEAMERDSIRFVGNDWFGANFDDLRAKTIAVISFIREECVHSWRESQNSGSGGDIGVLAWRQKKRDGSTKRIAQRMDFGCAPAARTTDRLTALPPFPPEAQR